MLVPRLRRAPGPQAVLLGPRLVVAAQPRGEAGDQGRHGMGSRVTCHVSLDTLIQLRKALIGFKC